MDRDVGGRCPRPARRRPRCVGRARRSRAARSAPTAGIPDAEFFYAVMRAGALVDWADPAALPEARSLCAMVPPHYPGIKLTVACFETRLPAKQSVPATWSPTLARRHTHRGARWAARRTAALSYAACVRGRRGGPRRVVALDAPRVRVHGTVARPPVRQHHLVRTHRGLHGGHRAARRSSRRTRRATRKRSPPV